MNVLPCFVLVDNDMLGTNGEWGRLIVVVAPLIHNLPVSPLSQRFLTLGPGCDRKLATPSDFSNCIMALMTFSC